MKFWFSLICWIAYVSILSEWDRFWFEDSFINQATRKSCSELVRSPGSLVFGLSKHFLFRIYLFLSSGELSRLYKT